MLLFVPERAARVVEQQERERAAQQQASPRAGTPVGAMMGMTPGPGNPLLTETGSETQIHH